MTQPNVRKKTLVKGRVIKRPAKKFGNIRPFIYRERLFSAHYTNVSAQQKSYASASSNDFPSGEPTHFCFANSILDYWISCTFDYWGRCTIFGHI